MRFPYQSSLIVGAAPPSFAPGSTLRWRPFAPVTILHPVTKQRRQFNRALLDTGADQTVFPERLLATLALTPISAPGQAMVWRGVSYAMIFALAQLRLTDGIDDYRWNAVVGFSSAPIPYIVLGQAGCLDYFDARFFGYARYTEFQKNASFPGVSP